MHAPSQQTLDDPANGRRVSGFTAACVLVSNVIGSGIFTTTGFMARDLGDPAVILLLWGFGACLTLAGALSYSELGAALPYAGGEYVYLRRAYGPFLAFLSGWASFTVGFSAAIAAGAMSFAAYAWQLVSPGGEAGGAGTLLALALLWLLTAVHLAGVGPGGLAQRLLTLSKVGAVFLFLLGAWFVGQGSWAHLAEPGAPAGPGPGPGKIIASLMFVIFAYSGWNAAGYIAGEIEDPGRAIPRAMLWGTLFIGCLYLLLNLVYFYALPVGELAAPPLLPVAEKAATALFGPQAARFITLLLCLSIAAAVSAMVWAGPRVYYAMARDGALPQVFAAQWGAGRAPGPSIILQSLWATLLILSGTFEQLVIYSGFVLIGFSALAVSCVIVLRRRQPDLPRPYRVPLYPLLPGLFIVVSLIIIAYGLIQRPMEAVMAAGTLLAGAPLYGLMRRRGGR
ncbi:MAG: amino acid permease [Nitrospirota bacterium]|nr:amino acid permease [Nitrospirota bacterium]